MGEASEIQKSSTDYAGEKFLNENVNLTNNRYVELAAKNLDSKEGQLEHKPEEKIHAFMKVLEQTHLSHRDDQKVMERIRNSYHKKFIVKPENVPESYFDNQRRLHRERGHGEVNITDNIRQQSIDILRKDQEVSFDRWFDYLTSKDADFYPTWAKYWAFEGVARLGGYDKESGSFKKRDETTVAPYPDLNQEALAKAIDVVINKYGAEYFRLTELIEKAQRSVDEIADYRSREEIVRTGKKNGKEVDKKNLKRIAESLKDQPIVGDEKELQEELNGYKSQLSEYVNSKKIPIHLQETGPVQDDFGSVYAQTLNELGPENKEGLQETNGKWVKYEKGKDHMPLVNSLQGHNTGWCTAGEETAKKQLQGGDFYVYYSYGPNDSVDKPSIPRVAIRMEGEDIGEIRGISERQNLDPFIGQVVEDKLRKSGEFKDYDIYLKKVADMQRLTDIDNRFHKGEQLSGEDLYFLYEIDSKIDGFGYNKDPRIDKILFGRDNKKDLSLALGVGEENISTNTEEALRGNIVYHYGNLNLRWYLTSGEGIVLPKIVRGDLDLEGLPSGEGLVLPERIEGNLNLDGLTSKDGLTLPKTVGGNFFLGALTSGDGLILPETVGGDLYLNNVTSGDGMILPKTVGRDLDLGSLTTSVGLALPETVGGYLDLKCLTSGDGVTLPKTVGGDLNLHRLITSEGLTLPETVVGYLDLAALTSGDGLVFPETVGEDLYLNNLNSGDGLILPETVGGDLILNSLTSGDGLVLPRTVGGDLNLHRLITSEGLTLPETVGGDLILNSLTSGDGLVLPKSVNGRVYLPETLYDENERAEFMQKYSNLEIIFD